MLEDCVGFVVKSLIHSYHYSCLANEEQIEIAFGVSLEFFLIVIDDQKIIKSHYQAIFSLGY